MGQDGHWFHAANFSQTGAFLVERGVTPAGLFKRCDVSPLLLLNPNGLLPRDVALRLLNEIGRMLGDRSAGL